MVGVKVADIADLDRDSGYLNIPGLEEKLRDEKKRWDFIHQQDPDKKWEGLVNIQADKAVPFRIVKRVMYSCGVAGYFSVNLATLDSGSYAATGGAARAVARRRVAPPATPGPDARLPPGTEPARRVGVRARQAMSGCRFPWQSVALAHHPGWPRGTVLAERHGDPERMQASARPARR